MADVPQFAFPPRIVNGRLLEVEQGQGDDLTGRVNVLCRTPPGWLDSRPGFGLADQVFRKGGADVSYVSQQLQAWVPDAAATAAHDRSVLDHGLDYLGLQVRA